MKRSPVLKSTLRDNGGVSKAHIARHSSPTPLVCVIIYMVVVKILVLMSETAVGLGHPV